jgi:multidrug efflux pump subunit AcrA (membrane-fusion protein)
MSSAANATAHRIAVPVVAAQAKLGDLPRFLSGIGTVTPLATVTVQSRVPGQIMAVDFREGQIVTQGQLLVQIDPRPYQVQLEQARGQLALIRRPCAMTRLIWKGIESFISKT